MSPQLSQSRVYGVKMAMRIDGALLFKGCFKLQVRNGRQVVSAFQKSGGQMC